MKKYMISAFYLIGSISLQAKPAFKEILLHIEQNPALKAFMTIAIQTQHIPHPALTSIALKYLAETYILQSISEFSSSEIELQNYLKQKQNEIKHLRSLTPEFQKSILLSAQSEETKAFDAYIKSVHHRRTCEEALSEESSRA